MTTGLGIIDTDLCLWAKSATPAMIEEAWLVPSHPTIKAKPAPVPRVDIGWLQSFNCWVSSHPILATALLGGGYLLLRGNK